MIKNKTLQVMTDVPVKNEIGRFVFRQCRPKIRYQKPIKRIYVDMLDKTERLQHQLNLIKITKNS